METSYALSHELAKAFNKSALLQIAQHAKLCADLMVRNEPKVWRMADGERDALDTFRQLAAYASRVADMVSD